MKDEGAALQSYSCRSICFILQKKNQALPAAAIKFKGGSPSEILHPSFFIFHLSFFFFRKEKAKAPSGWTAPKTLNQNCKSSN